MAQPLYIDWSGHGGATVTSEGVFKGARAAAFGFDLKDSAAQALVDKLLAPAVAGVARYSVLGQGLVTFMRIARCGAEGRKGWMPGRECAVWLPLLEHRHGRLPRPVLWAPYVFIDYSVGMATGREIWGWAKSIGRILAPEDSGQAGFSCSTVIFRDTTIDGPGSEEILLEVTGAQAAPLQAKARPEDAFGGLAARLFPAKQMKAEGADRFLSELPAIALKQFPDSAQPTRACYQAVVNSPCRLTHFAGMGPIEGDLVLRIANCMSHGIATDLLGTAVSSIGTTDVPLLWGAHLEFDFRALPGSVVGT